jgi:tRNA 2-selenouridine synthase
MQNISLFLFLCEMAAERIHIEQFMQLAQTHPVFDVRSPAEYEHAHMPGANSLPLFTDAERKVVGTTYKQQSRKDAIKAGLEFFAPKMRQMVESVEEICQGLQDSGKKNTPDSKTILVYCWRGGMRSSAVSWLLDLYGFRVYTLVGGYKSFRNYILDTFSLPFNFKIVGGYTGSGKTEVLKELSNRGETVVDLEGLAKHKGSAFGNINMPAQPGQEMFENLLGMNLRNKIEKNDKKAGRSGITHSPFDIQNSPIWLEDESQRIGQVNLPGKLWITMRQSKIYFLEIPFEERLNHIVEEYGKLDRTRMLDAISRIKDKLGLLNAKKAATLLEEENTIESFRILLNYYDKFYLKALHNRKELNSLLHTVECKTVTPENASRLIAGNQYQYEKPKTDTTASLSPP